MLDRLKEPSTWAAFAAAAAAILPLIVPAATWQIITAAIVGIAAGFGVALKEKSRG